MAHTPLFPTCAGRISDLLKILLAYFTFSWKKELHVVSGDLSGTNDIAGSTRMVAWVDRGAYGLESEALGTGAMRVRPLPLFGDPLARTDQVPHYCWEALRIALQSTTCCRGAEG